MTAMPAHYRRMGDFQHYYYGSKIAPYLTVFIGGNHEASNHLFELHYGGWAAPNIYYLGAANVIKLGPIKIASTSGVYKKYDYQRPHFERLPYNNSDIRSIYHQRELDIRKLLSYTSQVDIGLSHDWPAGIEWLGDHKALFQRKGYLMNEAQTGDMGSKPSSWVMDRLRPPYWFSAHHHIKYAALKNHDVVLGDDLYASNAENRGPRPQKDFKTETYQLTSEKQESDARARNTNQGALSAWTSFKDHVKAQDAADDAREEEAIKARLEEQKRTGQHAVAAYKFEENFKEVSIDTSDMEQRRQVRSPEKQFVQRLPPQLDGSSCSVPCFSSKRRRTSSPSDDAQPNARPRHTAQANDTTSNNTIVNPDAIDIDMSDSDSDGEQRPLLTPPESIEEEAEGHTTSEQKTHHQDATRYTQEGGKFSRMQDQTRPDELRSFSRTSERLPSIQEIRSQESVQANNPFTDGAASNEDLLSHRPKSVKSIEYGRLKDGPDHDVDIIEPTPIQNLRPEKMAEVRRLFQASNEDVSVERPQLEVHIDASDDSDTDIPDDVRAQLAEMSSAFAPETKITKSPDLPFPAEITNKTTRFLALSKVEQGNNNDFLQLLEIEPYTNGDSAIIESRSLPYELEYDPEWLAITRVFAPELKLGGSKKDRIPADRGETYYRERIEEEEKWIQENIVNKGLLKVPQNFQVQTEQQVVDKLTKEEREAMPRELTNPQTSQFCELVGISNPFDISKEERDARIEEGPIPDEWQDHGGGRGRSRGGNRGNRGSRGNRGGRGYGGGRRGRGRG